MIRHTLATSARRPVEAKSVGGSTLIEVLVAFGLLATLLSVLIPTVVRHGRFLQALRHERLAMDELSNQLDVLSMLPVNEIQAVVAQVEPSAVVRASLKDVRLTAEATEADDGTRITLRINWDAPGRRDNPLQLSAWRYTSTGTSTTADSEPAGDSDPADDNRASRPSRYTERQAR